ncbi:MAG: zinc ribbon domain-containing protein [Chloroflexota bacterium]|nr:MAG: zinc ribbon domain-containing protein [Chloroflexota bacterium]
MPSCPICGTKVSEGSGFCSKCLRRLMKGQASKGKSKKRLVGIIIACVIVISVVIAVTTQLPKVPSGSVAELDYVADSAYGFAEEFFAPKLTGLQRDDLWENCEGKRVEWTSELTHVSSEKEGSVAYFVNPLNWIRTEIVAVFDEGQDSSLEYLNVGDLVTYTGVLASFGVAEIRLTDCTIVSLSVVPLWWEERIDTQNKRIMVGDEVICLGPSTYDDATKGTNRVLPKITTISRQTGKPLWESEGTESVLVGIDSHYVYTWHLLGQLVQRSELGDPYYWYASNVATLNITSGQILWSSYLAKDIDCREDNDCLPVEWSESDFVDCCVLGGSVREEIAEEGESGLTFLVDKPLISELTYGDQDQGIIYRTTCAVYGGAGIECRALQALDKQTGEVLWMMTFQEEGVNDFSIVDGILYVSTDNGVGAFEL